MLKPVCFVFCVIIMVIPSMLCFPSFLTISYRFHWCFRMFPLVILRFRWVFLLFPLSVSPVSYFRFCDLYYAIILSPFKITQKPSYEWYMIIHMHSVVFGKTTSGAIFSILSWKIFKSIVCKCQQKHIYIFNIFKRSNYLFKWR